MTESILDSLFKLPPPEKRTVLPAWILRRSAVTIGGKRRYDDLFIFYMAFRGSFFVAFFFSLLNIFSLAAHVRLNFYFFAIDLRDNNFVVTFLTSYGRYTVIVHVRRDGLLKLSTQRKIAGLDA